MSNYRPVLNLPLHLRIVRSLVLLAPFLLFFSFVTDPESLDNDVLKYTNQFRKSNGLPELQIREDLSKIARKHSEDMAKGKRDFGHGGFDQRYDKVKKIFQSCTVAENVAYGARTGQEVVTQWKNSSSHRKNMLGKYRYMGIGTSRDNRGRIYYTQILVR